MSHQPRIIAVPRVFLTTPFFTVRGQQGGRECRITEDDRRFVYQVGKTQSMPGDSLSVEDAELIFALLTFAKKGASIVSFGSFRALGVRIYGASYGAWAGPPLLRRLGRLRTVGIGRRLESAEWTDAHPVLVDWDLQERVLGGFRPLQVVDNANAPCRISWVQFSAEFLSWLQTTIDLDVSQYFELPSKLAKACYLYLPSQCFPLDRFTSSAPRCFSLAEILRRVGAVPGRPAEILRAFTRVDRGLSIADQLDGTRLANGRLRFQVRTDLEEPCAQMWIERSVHLAPVAPIEVSASEGGKLRGEWIKAGGSRAAWDDSMRRPLDPEIVSRELRLLVEEGVLGDMEANRNYRAVVSALRVLGPQTMDQIRSTTKGRIIESAADPTKALDCQGAFWMKLIKDAIADRAKAVTPA